MLQTSGAARAPAFRVVVGVRAGRELALTEHSRARNGPLQPLAPTPCVTVGNLTYPQPGSDA
ncbi:hypothetical protein SAMN06272775_4277 [Streptomyces sp. 2323.1]|nr:hypothetical protein SAMN06272775_4277 [Streptomyces sp. 2323.1]